MCGPFAFAACGLACATPTEAAASAAPASTASHGCGDFTRLSLLYGHRQMLGVRLVFLEQLQAGLQQALQLGVLGVGDERVGQGPVDRLVVGDLVVDVRLVEGG